MATRLREPESNSAGAGEPRQKKNTREKGKKRSGGQRQRVAVARGMIRRGGETMAYDLMRFLQAQEGTHDGTYSQALAEIRRGRKESHWIWYIFPQLKGLGRSS
ncbi:MAG: DUF1810 family protein, partial [Anaerobutyricum sp.]|nr:DUF1810 family protein [Anaerobutyricum sp.]